MTIGQLDYPYYNSGVRDAQMKKIIRQGYNNNQIVYDNYSPDISKRLIYLMIRQMPKITTIWIPTDEYPDFIPDDWSVDNIATLFVYGREIIREPKFNYDGEYTKYFLGELCGTLAKDDLNLIVGSNPLEEPSFDNTILGSC